ncbi:MAG: TA system VapC family ribonuclease toxin [Cyanobacteriota bacterium]
MSAALLDVNVLIALVDPRHVHHGLAHSWFASSAPSTWATCPITENAVLRILGNPRYPNSPGPPAVVAPLLQGVLHHPRHRFWPDGLSMLQDDSVAHDRLLESGQLTDAYLLALAVHHGGTLVTLDRRLRGDVVRGGAEALVLLLEA